MAEGSQAVERHGGVLAAALVFEGLFILAALVVVIRAQESFGDDLRQLIGLASRSQPGSFLAEVGSATVGVVLLAVSSILAGFQLWWQPAGRHAAPSTRSIPILWIALALNALATAGAALAMLNRSNAPQHVVIAAVGAMGMAAITVGLAHALLAGRSPAVQMEPPLPGRAA